MAFLDAIIGPVAGLLDKLIPDPRARDAAKLELLKLQGTQDLESVKLQLSAIIACRSACKKDPLSGVIGVQQGPLISTV